MRIGNAGTTLAGVTYDVIIRRLNISQATDYGVGAIYNDPYRPPTAGGIQAGVNREGGFACLGSNQYTSTCLSGNMQGFMGATAEPVCSDGTHLTSRTDEWEFTFVSPGTLTPLTMGGSYVTFIECACNHFNSTCLRLTM